MDPLLHQPGKYRIYQRYEKIIDPDSKILFMMIQESSLAYFNRF